MALAQRKLPRVSEADRLRRPLGIDLFSGVGGMSLGFEQAGFDVVASVEYDPVHAAIHAFNFPLTEVVCADVGTLDADHLLAAAKRGFLAHGHAEQRWSGRIDVIFGGPPCQGFSTIGKRDVGDDRNRLVYKFAKLVLAIKPTYFVLENVPGMAAGGHADILVRLMARLAKEYDVNVEPGDVRTRSILNAADYGVPQDRRRLVLVGALKGHAVPVRPIPTVKRVAKRRRSESDEAGALAGVLPNGPTVGDAIGDLPNLDDFDVLLETDEVRLDARLIAASRGTASAYARILRGEQSDPNDYSYPRVWDSEMLTSSLRTAHVAESIRRFEITEPGQTESTSRFYRLDEDGLCNTLRAGTGSEHGAYTSPRPIHPRLPRVISVREAARLHSFPDWFRLHRTKWNGFRSIGNAVPPLLARAIAGTIVRALGMTPRKPSKAVPLGDAMLLSVSRLKAAEYFKADLRRIPNPRQAAQ